MSTRFHMIAFAAAFAMALGAPAEESVGTTSAYVLEGAEGLVQRFAPIFVVEQDEESFNKIGTPSARVNERGKTEVYVDTSHPTIYTEVETFETERERYTNLIYRIHFERNPFTLGQANPILIGCQFAIQRDGQHDGAHTAQLA